MVDVFGFVRRRFRAIAAADNHRRDDPVVRSGHQALCSQQACGGHDVLLAGQDAALHSWRHVSGGNELRPADRRRVDDGPVRSARLRRLSRRCAIVRTIDPSAGNGSAARGEQADCDFGRGRRRSRRRGRLHSGSARHPETRSHGLVVGHVDRGRLHRQPRRQDQSARALRAGLDVPASGRAVGETPSPPIAWWRRTPRKRAGSGRSRGQTGGADPARRLRRMVERDARHRSRRQQNGPAQASRRQRRHGGIHQLLGRREAVL